MRWFLFVFSVLALAVAGHAQGTESHAAPDSGVVEAVPTAEASPSSSPAPEGVGGDVDRFLDRYLWVMPEARGHKASVGIALLCGLALIVMMSARIANLDGVTFGRAVACALALVVVGFLEIALVPAVWPLIALVIVLDLVIWFVLVRAALGGDFFNGAVMLVSGAFAVMLSLLGIEIVGTLLQRSALMS